MTKYLLVMTTVPDPEVGRIIAEKVIEERLAACVTQSSAGQSLYWWQGKITQDQEYILFIKTTKDAFPRLEKTVLQIHPYDVPEIIALPIAEGSKEYLKWIDRETRT